MIEKGAKPEKVEDTADQRDAAAYNEEAGNRHYNHIENHRSGCENSKIMNYERAADNRCGQTDSKESDSLLDDK